MKSIENSLLYGLHPWRILYVPWCDIETCIFQRLHTYIWSSHGREWLWCAQWLIWFWKTRTGHERTKELTKSILWSYYFYINFLSLRLKLIFSKILNSKCDFKTSNILNNKSAIYCMLKKSSEAQSICKLGTFLYNFKVHSKWIT